MSENNDNKVVNMDKLSEEQKEAFSITDLPDEGIDAETLRWEDIKEITEDTEKSLSLSTEITDVVLTMIEKDSDVDGDHTIHELRGIKESFNGIQKDIDEFKKSEVFSNTGELADEDDIFDYFPAVQNASDVNDRLQEVNKHLFVDVVPRIKSVAALEELNKFGAELKKKAEEDKGEVDGK